MEHSDYLPTRLKLHLCDIIKENVMRSLCNTSKLNACKGDHVYSPTTCFSKITAGHVLIKFYILEILTEELEGHFDCNKDQQHLRILS
jgi:hypothetical protein